MTNRPNLFSFATKELSQDAMICWLVKWSGVMADTEEEKGLQACGEAFVDALLGEGRELAGPVKGTSIYRQDKDIDVLALVKDQGKRHVLLIEDKTHTRERGGQLQGYLDRVKNGETRVGKEGKHWDLLHPIYLKTGNQSLAADERIEKQGYRVFRRKEWLRVLDAYEGNHPILIDFREHLRCWENQFLSFRNWRKDRQSKWSRAGWQGFFRCLEGFLCACDWSYVSNQSGGFLGYWWRGIPDQEADAETKTKVYFQLEIVPGNPNDQSLCFKVRTKSNDRQALKRKWHARIMETGSSSGIHICRPKRMRIGNTMTVAEWDSWLVFDGGRLDVERTVESLRLAEEIVRKAAKP